MSTDRDLQRALASGDLRLLPMQLASDPVVREVLLAREVQSLVLGPYQTSEHEKRAGQLRADLESFNRGQQISMSLTPRKHKGAAFGLMEPVGEAVFEFRSRNPSPGLRIFGHFLKVDTFVALTWYPRSKPVDWSTKVPLGADGPRWRIAQVECTEKWFDILPNSVPIAGQKGDNYVSSSLYIL